MSRKEGHKKDNDVATEKEGEKKDHPIKEVTTRSRRRREVDIGHEKEKNEEVKEEKIEGRRNIDLEASCEGKRRRRRHCTSFRLVLRRQLWVNTVRMAATLRKLFKSRRSSSAGGKRKKSDRSDDLLPSLQPPSAPPPSAASPRLFSTRVEGTGARVAPSESLIGGGGASARHSSPPQPLRSEESSSPPPPSSREVSSSRNRNLLASPHQRLKTVRSRRLLREFHELTKSQMAAKNPIFTVDLINDCLYEWKIKLLRIDPESELSRDMVEFNIRHILLSLSFPETFPFQPPFLRVLAPKLEKGFVMEGGAICMELLTPRGWASAYTIEAVVMQFAASLVKGHGRIARKQKTRKEFSQRSAEASFKSLVKTHDKYGWLTPPMSEG